LPALDAAAADFPRQPRVRVRESVSEVDLEGKQCGAPVVGLSPALLSVDDRGGRSACGLGSSGLDRLAKLGALGALEPEPEHVPLAVEVDADRWSILTEPCSVWTVFSLKPFAGVADPARRGLAALVAEMIGQLGVIARSNSRLVSRLKRPSGAGDLLRRASAGEQLVDQLVRKILALGVRGDDRHRLLWKLLAQRGLLSELARRSGIRERRHPLNSDHAYTGNRTDPAAPVELFGDDPGRRSAS
jgi:hypothetical protein